MNSVKEKLINLIEINRQTGSTTICIKSAIENDAYFIVANDIIAKTLKIKHPELQIFSILQLDKLRGLEKKPIILDLSVINELKEPFHFSTNQVKTVYINNPNKKLSNQVNIKLSDEDFDAIKKVSVELNEVTAHELNFTNVVRMLIKKGLEALK